MQQLLLLLAWRYYRHLFLCVTPAFELAFPVSPPYSAALHPSGTCPGTAPLGTGARRMAAVNAGIQQACSDTLAPVVEEMSHGRSTSSLQGNMKGWRGDCFSRPTASGTCEPPSTPCGAVLPSERGQAGSSPAAVSRHLDGVHSLHFKPLHPTHPLPSKFPLQPTEKRGAPGAQAIPPAAVQLSLLGSPLLPTGCREGAGN